MHYIVYIILYIHYIIYTLDYIYILLYIITLYYIYIILYIHIILYIVYYLYISRRNKHMHSTHPQVSTRLLRALDEKITWMEYIIWGVKIVVSYIGDIKSCHIIYIICIYIYVSYYIQSFRFCKFQYWGWEQRHSVYHIISYTKKNMFITDCCRCSLIFIYVWPHEIHRA